MLSQPRCVICDFVVKPPMQSKAYAGLGRVCQPCFMALDRGKSIKPGSCVYELAGEVHAALHDYLSRPASRERWIRINERTAAREYEALCGCPECRRSASEALYSLGQIL